VRSPPRTRLGNPATGVSAPSAGSVFALKERALASASAVVLAVLHAHLSDYKTAMHQVGRVTVREIGKTESSILVVHEMILRQRPRLAVGSAVWTRRRRPARQGKDGGWISDSVATSRLCAHSSEVLNRGFKLGGPCLLMRGIRSTPSFRSFEKQVLPESGQARYGRHRVQTASRAAPSAGFGRTVKAGGGRLR